MKGGDWRINRSASMLPSGRVAYYQSTKDKVHAALGGCCGSCGHRDARVLQIDHVESDGAAERKAYSGTSFLLHVLANATSGRYQLLCANCNWIKRHTKAEVPKVYAPDFVFPTEPPHIKAYKPRMCACGATFVPTNGRQRQCGGEHQKRAA